MAQLVYIDESGSPGKAARGQEYLILVGAIVDESAVRPLSDRMEQLAVRHLGQAPSNFEFHGQEIWSGKGPWAGKSCEQLLSAFSDVIALLDELNVHLVHSAIDKTALNERYGGKFDANAYQLSLQFLLEKLDRWRDPSDPKKLRILIADEAKQEELRAIEMVADMQKWGMGITAGPFTTEPLATIIDSMHFVDSKHSPGVQLADMVAFVLHRRRLGKERHPNAEAAVGRMSDAIRGATATWREAWPPRV